MSTPAPALPRAPFPQCPPWCDVPPVEHWEAATDDTGAYVHVRAWEVAGGSIVLSSVQGLTHWVPSEEPALVVELPRALLTRDEAAQLAQVLDQAVTAWGATACSCGLCPGNVPTNVPTNVPAGAPAAGPTPGGAA